MSVLKIKDDNSVWHEKPAGGVGVPQGGSQGDVLVKASEDDYDTGWGEVSFPDPYPVGSIYISTNSTSPASIFGGTWARITGRFLLAATDGGAQGGNSNASIAPGYTGGEATHQLLESEIPSHTHRTNIRNQGSGGGTTTHGTWGTSGTDNITSSATGGSGEHNTMPPYLSVYVWERTA